MAIRRLGLRAGSAAKTINLEAGTLRALLLRNRLWEPIRQDVRVLIASSAAPHI